MTVTLEDSSSIIDDEDNFKLIGNPECINQGSRSIKNTTIRYGDFALEQYDLHYSDAIIHIDGTYYSLIGRVLVSFSVLENMLDRMIMHITNSNTDIEGVRLVNMFTFVQKLNYLASGFMLYIDDDKKEALRSLSKNIESCIEVRNLIAHAKWQTITYDGFVRCQTRTDKHGYIYFRYFEFTNDTLNGLIDSVEEVMQDVIAFLKSDEILRENLAGFIDDYEDDE